MPLAVDSGPALERVPLGDPTDAPLEIAVDALHDGEGFPWPAPCAARREVRAAHEARRAFGTTTFAAELARQLGQPAFLRARVARVALDLERPPGMDPRGRARAVGAPVAGLLDDEARGQIGPRLYAAWRQLAELRAGARLTVSVTRDPELEGPLAFGASTGASVTPTWLDPMVPPALLERTADPFLVEALAGIAGALERPLPEDGLVVRAAVFDWMRFVQGRLGARGEPLDPAGRRMWSALLDVHGLSAETWAVRAHLHHGLEAPPAVRDVYRQMRSRYLELQGWVEARRAELLAAFFRRPERADHLAVTLGGAPVDLALATRLAEIIRERVGPPR